MLAGVSHITIIVSPEHEFNYKELLGTGEQLGIELSYKVQISPTGIPDTLMLVSEDYYKESVMVVLGDNFIYGVGLGKTLKNAYNGTGAMIFGYQVANPSAYGVIEFDKNSIVKSIEEKPFKPKSDFAVPGIYFLDQKCFKYAHQLTPSSRGETEITDLLKIYAAENELKVSILGRGITWLDTGSFENLLDASDFVRTIEKRQGLKIGCIEEIAYREGFISQKQFEILLTKYPKNEYSAYLKNII
jgi:glucose-1-phosphate thymidylyltransferase